MKPYNIHYGVARKALAITHGIEIFDPLDDRCQELIIEHPELCHAAIKASEGDYNSLQTLAEKKPDLMEYVFHKVRAMQSQYDRRMARVSKKWHVEEEEKAEEYIPSPQHTCGGYRQQEQPESDLLATFYKNGKAKTKRRFHGRREWRTCAGCAHDRILRETAKIQEEQKLYTIYSTILTREEYKKITSKFTTWRQRAMQEWHQAISNTPEGEILPKPPKDIVYIGYKISGAVVMVHNQPRLNKRGKEIHEISKMPTSKRAIYTLIGTWVADIPQDSTRQFIMGSRGFGKSMSGTRGAIEKNNDAETKSVTFKFPRCSKINEKKVMNLLRLKEINRYGLGIPSVEVGEFHENLLAMGIDFEIVGGKQRLDSFVTNLVLIVNKYDDKLRHKEEILGQQIGFEFLSRLMEKEND